MTESPLQRKAVYDTADLQLASFIACRRFTIVDIRRDSDRTIFVFHDSPELRRAIVDYANNGLVGVRSFCNTLRDLKSLTRETGDRRRTSGLDRS